MWTNGEAQTIYLDYYDAGESNCRYVVLEATALLSVTQPLLTVWPDRVIFEIFLQK